jgi:hypothetical protein
VPERPLQRDLLAATGLGPKVIDAFLQQRSLVLSRKKVDTDSYLWQTVLSVTGQDDNLLNADVGAS